MRKYWEKFLSKIMYKLVKLFPCCYVYWSSGVMTAHKFWSNLTQLIAANPTNIYTPKNDDRSHSAVVWQQKLHCEIHNASYLWKGCCSWQSQTMKKHYYQSLHYQSIYFYSCLLLIFIRLNTFFYVIYSIHPVNLTKHTFMAAT